MTQLSVPETVPIAQVLSPEDHFQIAAEHFYAYLRPTGAPTWELLTRQEQRHVRNALMLGAAPMMVDLLQRGARS